MTELNWQCAKDYLFTKCLDNAGWAWEFLRRNPEYITDWSVALQRQQEFTKYQAGKRFGQQRNPFVMFDPPLPSGKSPDQWLMKEGVEYYPPLVGYGKKWGLNGHIHDPTNDSPPSFGQVASVKLLDWGELGEHYTPAADYPDTQVQTSHIAVVGIDLGRTTGSIQKDLKKIITREKKLRSVTGIPQNHSKKRDNWPIYLRILDAKSQSISHAKIGAVLMPEKDESAAKTTISQYLHNNIARLIEPNVYILLANSPS